MSESNEVKLAVTAQILKQIQEELAKVNTRFDKQDVMFEKYGTLFEEQRQFNHETTTSLNQLKEEFKSNSVTLKDYKLVRDRIQAAGYVGKLLWGSTAFLVGAAIWFKDAWLQLVVK